MFEQEIIKVLKKHVSSDIKLEVPPDQKMGDFAFACFVLAKECKKSPLEVAKELADKVSRLTKPDFVDKIEAKGPYVNFFLNTSKMGVKVIERVEKEHEHYGSSHSGKGKHALIEHTSINPNASPHVGRARNAMIGDCIARLLKFEGFNTRVHYFVNDVGKQIAMLVVGCEGKSNVNFNDLLQIYIDINKQAKDDESVEKKVFALLKKFEEGDGSVRAKFRVVVDICIKGQSKILSELNINYDHYDYESDYIVNDKLQSILDGLKQKGKLITDEENRQVLDLDGFNLPLKNPVMVLTRADGTSLYGLRDLAYNLDKNNWAKGQNIVVLGEDQKTYLLQIKAALSLLGEQSPDGVHYSFVLLSDGKMSTRKGNVVLLEDFMFEAKKKAHEVMRAQLSEEKATKLAKTVAYGAVKFAILKVSNEKTATFDWESALSFEGDTSVYCQYAHARIHSIFRKANVHEPKLPKGAIFNDSHEHKLLTLISHFPSIVSKTLENKNPSTLAHFVFEVAKAFSEFYHACPVLQGADQIKSSRLALCNATRIVLDNGLNLLGIGVPDEM